jgi:uncharacterized protein (DUF2267 family)
MSTTPNPDNSEARQRRHEAHVDATHHKFLQRAAAELDLSDADSERAVLAVLRTLETRLPDDAMIALASQLPSTLRDQLARCDVPAPAQPRGRNQEDFLEQVAEELKLDGGRAEARVRGVFRVLAQSVSQGQIAKVIHLLPSGVRELWPTHS